MQTNLYPKIKFYFSPNCTPGIHELSRGISQLTITHPPNKSPVTDSNNEHQLQQTTVSTETIEHATLTM